MTPRAGVRTGASATAAALLTAVTLALAVTLMSACSGEAPDRSGEGASDPPAPRDAPASAADDPADDARGDRLPSPPAEACRAVLQRGLLLEPGDRETLREQLGPPDSVGVEAVPNRHVDGVTDSVVTLVWEGVEAVVHRVGDGARSGERELIDAIRVRSDEHLRWDGIGPGRRIESVILRLGDPPIRSDDSFAYLCSPGPGVVTPLVFHHADGRVTVVEWDFYVD